MKLFRITLALISLVLLTASCDDSKSYAELLSDERKATNAYLATQKVINEIPADTVFEEGENAPFYRIDEEGNVYMQVISSGTTAQKTMRKSISDGCASRSSHGLPEAKYMPKEMPKIWVTTRISSATTI